MKRLVPALAFGLALLLPATSSLAQGKLDHLICYRMNDQLNVRATVDMLAELQPDFTQRRCRLDGAAEFCVPASKLNVQPPPALPGIVGQPLQDDYVCYNVRCRDQSQPPDKIVTDQFGRRIERNFRARHICVPARKAPLPCGGRPNDAGMCGGACDTGQTCTLTANGRRCACAPQPCGGPVDAAGMCGGTCTDPNLQCVPDANNICQCQTPPPPPCGTNSTGQCGGFCAGNTVCAINATPGQPPCACQPPPPPPCGLDPTTKQCGGFCPNGVTCVANTDPLGTPCICPSPPPLPCGPDPLNPNQCSGTCNNDPTLVCMSTATGCNCVPATSPSCGNVAGGGCGGTCPAPQTCTSLPGSNVCQCQ